MNKTISNKLIDFTKYKKKKTPNEFIEVKGKYLIEDIANYFLAKSDDISPKKLQKILYFAYSWHLVLTNNSIDVINNRLFKDRFEAWIYGPVTYEIFKEYKVKQASNIERYHGEQIKLSEQEVDILDDVWNVYGRYSADELVSISCQHLPWQKARERTGCSPSLK